MRSNMLSVIPYYRIGTISTAKDVSLYSGTLALLGTLGIIYSRNIKLSKKIISILFMALILLCLYYQPLYMVFSLFVNPNHALFVGRILSKILNSLFSMSFPTIFNIITVGSPL